MLEDDPVYIFIERPQTQYLASCRNFQRNAPDAHLIIYDKHISDRRAYVHFKPRMDIQLYGKGISEYIGFLATTILEVKEARD